VTLNVVDREGPFEIYLDSENVPVAKRLGGTYEFPGIMVSNDQCGSHNSYVKVLTPTTSECDCIERLGL
jgi:hypothetical protein